MKNYFNIFIIIFFTAFLGSCSSISDWNASKIIEKTENWLFNKEDNFNEKDGNNNENDEEEFREDNVQVEEVFPDINDVPQIKPDFEQIDESFFESEEEEINNIDIDTNIEVGQVNQKENII